MVLFVRPATPVDRLAVRRILDGAMLEPGDVESGIARGDVFVAGDHRGGEASTERILGTIVLNPRAHGAYISAIAVRRRHRDRGLGRKLIERALEREGRLTARFDQAVWPFYESLGFSIETIADGRYRGYLD